MKKKSNNVLTLLTGTNKHKLRIMKLLVLGILLSVFNVAGSVYSQRTTFNFSYNNISIGEVLQEIESSSDYKFLYRTDLVDLERRVNLQASNNRIEEVLAMIFIPGETSFRFFEDNLIAITNHSSKVVVQNEVRGQVIDAENGEPLPGVNIMIQGTLIGTVTDFNGEYSITVDDPEAVLVFSFIGYVSSRVRVGENRIINIRLIPDLARLDEVVVIGYGVQRKSDLTGAVGHIGASELNEGVLTDPIQGIQGKMAGVSVTKRGGDPNAGFEIKIRGASSYTTGTAPLFVVDGVPGVDPTTISPDDIESYSVLKDASAAAIYGSRGAFGVILITTKRGTDREGARIDFNTYYSNDVVTSRLDLLTGEQYRNFVSNNPSYAPQFIDGGANTNWQNQVFRTGISQNYSLAFSGGDEFTAYRASISHNDIQGAVIGSDRTRTIGRINLDQTALGGRLTVSSGFAATFERNNYINYDGWGSNSIIFQAFQRNPTDPLRLENGEYHEADRVFQYFNPVNLVEQIHDERDAKRYFGFLNVNMEIFDGLVAGANIGYTRDDHENFYFEPTTMYRGSHSGYGRRNYENSESRLLETTLRYFNSFGGHNIESVGGYSFQEDFFTAFRAEGRQPFLNYTRMHDLGMFQSVTPGNIGSDMESNRLISFFLRGIYNWDQRYFLTGTIRRDGSSRFGIHNKWGWFPSVSAMWNITNEDFLRDNRTINNLRIRAGYGLTGNQEISNYRDVRWYESAGTAPNFETGEQSILLRFAHEANPDLKWEENAELNIGVDFGLLDNRISGSFDYFNKTIYDLLGPYSVPVPPNRVDRIWANVGEFRTTGFEMFIQTFPVRRSNFDWRTAVTFLTYNQDVITLGGEFNWERLREGYLSGPGLVGADNWTQTVDEGISLGTWFMPEYAGLSADGKFLFHTAAGGVTREIQNAERRIVGSALPDFELGWSNYITMFRNIDINFTMRAIYGYEIFNTTRMIFGNPIFLPDRNVLSVAIDEYDRGLRDNPKVSSYYLEDASFLRLDNVSLGYNFMNAGLFERIRVYVASNNVFTLTNYSGIDPEISTTGLSFGLDQYNVYPKTRTLTFGINVTL
jgi:TonB-dependent starch-binding outer membrane protein SusC